MWIKTTSGRLINANLQSKIYVKDGCILGDGEVCIGRYKSDEDASGGMQCIEQGIIEESPLVELVASSES